VRGRPRSRGASTESRRTRWEPPQIAADELAERRGAVGLVLHRLADDAGGLAERQGRRPAIREMQPVKPDDLARRVLSWRDRRFVEQLELAARLGYGPHLLVLCCHPRRLTDGPRPELARSSPRTRPSPPQRSPRWGQVDWGSGRGARRRIRHARLPGGRPVSRGSPSEGRRPPLSASVQQPLRRRSPKIARIRPGPAASQGVPGRRGSPGGSEAAA
jgi:hypothetical protein